METTQSQQQVLTDEQSVAGSSIPLLPSVPSIVETAIAYAAAGLSVIPVSTKKIPALPEWKPFQTEIAGEATIRGWNFPSNGIALVCGAVSGNLETIDIDEKYNLDNESLFDRYKRVVDTQRPGLFEKLVIEETVSGGYHLIYRCSQIDGNTKLAERNATEQEASSNKNAKSFVLIETRGEGGYFVCAPSPGYSLKQKTFYDIATISREEREILFCCARSMNSFIKKENIVTGITKGSNVRKRPGDLFNETGAVNEDLIDVGWAIDREDDEQVYWRRPGKDEGVSATFHKKKGLLYVFSSNANPFEPGKAYTKFAVYTMLKHDGDFKAASKTLAAKGYGTPQVSSDQNIVKLETYLNSNYEFKYNAVLGQTEFRRLGETDFTRLEDYELNSIYRELLHENLPVTFDALHRILCSDFCTSIDPFVDYFVSLPEWDGSIDYIATLAGTLSISNDEQKIFIECLKRWLVGQVSCAIDHTANQTSIILQGPQGIGKSTWLNRLIPPSLSEYKLIGTIDPENKDTLIHLSQTMLINLDELETLKPKAIGSLKTVMTMPHILLRRPYGRYSTVMPRRASFVGSVNRSDFLEDPTGNRRFLVFEVNGVDLNTSVDMDGVYSQAVSLYKSGYRTWFNQEEITKVNESNKRFMHRTHEHELLNLYCCHGIQGEVLSQWLTPTEVAKKIADEDKKFSVERNAVRNIGISLTAEEYEYKLSKGSKKYFVMFDPRIRNQV